MNESGLAMEEGRVRGEKGKRKREGGLYMSAVFVSVGDPQTTDKAAKHTTRPHKHTTARFPLVQGHCQISPYRTPVTPLARHSLCDHAISAHQNFQKDENGELSLLTLLTAAALCCDCL